MSVRRFTESMALHVLSHEHSTKRFEDFCVELFRDVEQVEYVRTSSTWDHGRDGRDSSTRSGPVPPFLCCTLRDDLLLKALSDVARLVQKAKPDRVLICCAAPVSEHLAIGVERRLRDLLPGDVAVRVNGREQVSQLTVRYPRAMDSFYVGELAELRGVCAADTSLAAEESLTGLRIALTTQLHEDAQERRADLIRNLILTALSERQGMTLVEIANFVSQSLHLPRSVQVAFLQGEIDALVASSRIIRDGARFQITEVGEADVKKRLEEGISRLSVGATEIRNVIENLTGAPLTNEEWRPTWGILRDSVCTTLLSRGAEIVEEICAIMEGDSTPKDLPDFREHVERVGQRIRALPGGGPRIEEIAQAVMDMFFERTSDAFVWLADLCAVFVDLCSLGLEPRAQSEIIAELRYFTLLLDTDIVLSLLSEGEPNNPQVREIVAGWGHIDGKVLVAPPVLEEASYHAFIADSDYTPTWRRLHLMSDEDALHEIENVFVRGFRVAGKGHYEPNRWRQYISAFRGTSHHDYDKIRGLLGDHGIAVLPESAEDAPLTAKLERKLFDERKSECSDVPREIKILQEKCNRDGRLVALAIGERRREKVNGSVVVIVSASSAIRQAVGLADMRTAVPQVVMHLSAIAWLLSQSPGVRLTLGALRGVLFDAGFRRRMGPIERQVVRTVRASEQYNLHWSRRNTLQRAVRQQLAKIAAQRGEQPADIERKVLNQDQEAQETFTSAVAEALDQISRSRSEEDLRALQNRVQELEQDLEEARRKR